MTASATTSATAEPTGTVRSPGRGAWLAVGGCALIAVLSLLVADEPAYDPTAWLIWGRQISEGFLETIAGPSWKPLPVVVTAPAALLGDDVAPLLWLVVARTGGLLAVVLAFRLAAIAAREARAGAAGARAAGLVAAASLLLATGFLSGVVRGNSEGLLVALVLFGLERQIAGRAHVAFGLFLLAALLRPEAWPILALQSLWLLREAHVAGRSLWPVLGVLALCGLGVLLAWFIPEKIGSGDFLRAASRAREPVADSPAQADRPFLAVFTNGASALGYPVYAGAVVAVVAAWRHRRRITLGLAAVSAGWMVVVAFFAEAGFTGNLRYVTMPASLVCVLAGAGWFVLVRGLAAWRRPAAVLAIALAVPGVVLAIGDLGDELDRLADDERLYGALPEAIARAGGAAAVRSCGQVITGPFQTQAVAWELHLREVQVALRGDPPGVILVRRGNPLGGDERYELVDRGVWTVRTAC